MTRSVHECALTYLEIYGRGKRGAKRRALLREAARAGLELAAQEATAHLERDYRQWVPEWRLGSPIGVGSGRAANWCHIVYLQYSFLARLVHTHLGWTGERVRSTARALQAGIDGGGHDWQPPADFVPTREMMRVASLPPPTSEFIALDQERACEDSPLAVRRAQWRIWLARVAGPAWGRYMLDHEIARLRADAAAQTPPMIVGEIRRLRGEQSTDYRGCSGCQDLAVLAERPELHDWLLSRAGAAQHCTLRAGGLMVDAVRVPFGLPTPQGFDHVLVLTMNSELRIRSADWGRLDAVQRSALLRGES